MTSFQLWISFYTIIRKETVRIFRIWSQTLLPSVVTAVLYFVVFGTVLGSRIGEMQGFSYTQFVVPGLVMLAVITNAFSNVATTFFTSKFFARNIDELLVSPTPPPVIIAGFIAGGVIRGVTVGILVLITAMFFALPVVAHLWVIALFLILSSTVASLGGLWNGIYAKNFDGIMIIPTFVLTPLVYLGGVFYSVQSLPAAWQSFTYANPIFYIINGFRYGFLGFSDVPIATCVSVLLALTGVFVAINWYLLRTGLGLKQ